MMGITRRALADDRDVGGQPWKVTPRLWPPVYFHGQGLSGFWQRGAIELLVICEGAIVSWREERKHIDIRIKHKYFHGVLIIKNLGNTP